MKIHFIFSLKMIFSLAFLNSCQTLDVKQNLNSTSFKVVATFYVKQHTEKLTMYANLKDKNLRIDILKPFVGYIAHAYLNKKQMIIHVPSQTAYYKGPFKSQLLVPRWKSLSYEQLLSILKGRPMKIWNCEYKKHPPCVLEVAKRRSSSWFRKQKLIHQVNLKISKNRRALFVIERLSGMKVEHDVFNFKAGHNRRLSFSQFQKLFEIL